MASKSFGRRLARTLAGMALVLGLAGASAPARPSARPSWWEVKLTVTVSGGYALKGAGAPLAGEFVCRARWEGSMESDAEDFLLYHFRTEILDWRLTERSARPGGETVLGEKDGVERPNLRLNYVLKDGKSLDLDFSFIGVPVPLHPFPVKVGLEFPVSEVRPALLEGSGYADFIVRGSNRVVLHVADLQRPSAERKFAWEWRRERRLAAGTGSALLDERHQAEVVVSLVAH